jgi:hypothetical protein
MGLGRWKKEQKEITVTFDREGEMEVEGHGFVGKACEAASKFIENLLGKTKSRKKKTDAYKQGVEKVQHTQH